MRFDARAREWLERALGPRHRVVGARRVRGGVTSVVHCVRVVDRSGTVAPFMLRRVPVRPGEPTHDPVADVLTESSVFRVAGGGPIPELVAVDPSGTECGVAALIATWLPGRPDVAPRDPAAWVRELAAALEAVPAEVGPGPRFASFVPWFDAERTAPTWSRVPGAWTRVRAGLDTMLPKGGRPRFVHRDFHPGNVLLSRGRCSGVVDWTNAAIGAPEVDVSRARVEISVLAGMDAADEFLRLVTDPAEYDPLWDALVACELGSCAHDLLEFNRIGAGLTLAHIGETLDTLVENAARHL